MVILSDIVAEDAEAIVPVMDADEELFGGRDVVLVRGWERCALIV